MVNVKQSIAIAAIVMLSACSTTMDPIDRDFGEAHRWNFEQQVVNPDPEYAEDAAMEGGNGERAAEAVERYQSGDVEQPANIDTTSNVGGGPN
ncbi:hypothetical protein HFP51_09800 [Parasphingopyxis sp. CP4]|uniref:hypothetical protein n=1 Tax=Parasphingopyxis sp. CP4 TaxID=2724527 RepID=UPI0015A3237D|nr:hypothetical protein [Parasphingopyxis sp. CP4]QLC22447.1 hypothetical protein HFP51_09800 [Parasphingopyxis sp. CP4]